MIAAARPHYTKPSKASDPTKRKTRAHLAASNPPPRGPARPHPSSPRLGSYWELAASPHLAVGLRPGRLVASPQRNQDKRGLELAGIEGRLARRGARLASGGCLVGAVLLFSRRCVVSAAASGSFVVVSSVRALSLVPRVRGRRVAWRRSSPSRSFLRVCLGPRWVWRPAPLAGRSVCWAEGPGQPWRSAGWREYCASFGSF